MKAPIIALLLATVLAGCITLGASTDETLTMRIETDGPYRVGIPVPLHRDTPTVDAWIEGVRIPIAATRAWQGADTALVLVEGEGPVTIFLSQEHKGDAEAYLDATWSAGGNDTHIQAGIWAGQVTVRVAYGAESPYCGRTDQYTGTGEAEIQRDDDQPLHWFDLVGERVAVCQ